MKNNNYKIVVFTDLKESLNKTLKSTLNFAKMINGEIALFHVKKASDIVNKASQLSAMRTLNSDYLETEKKMKSVVKDLSLEFGVPVTYSFTVGNLKNEIKSYITEEKPDIIVLEKRKTKLLSFIGDNLINYVLKQHNGPVFLADDQSVFELNKELSLGILDNTEQAAPEEITERLQEHSKKSIKTFKILETSNKVEAATNSKQKVEFVFEKNDNTIKNLSNYLTLNKVNLLCINRANNKQNKNLPNINDIISNVNVPLLLVG